MNDIEAPPAPETPSSSEQPSPRRFEIGAFTSLCLAVSALFYVSGIGSWFTFSPAHLSLLSPLLAPFFPFAGQLSGFLVNLMLLLFFSTFFERKLGSLGFFVKLEFFKVLLVLLSWSVYRFFYFIHPNSSLVEMFYFKDFSILFMILVSQEAFERPNDFSIIPVVNVSFKNVQSYIHYE